jgi:F420-non-reducing hydrogenase large subunit
MFFRGTLYHHYKTDRQGLITEANVIVGTTNNNGAINLSVKKAASNFIKDGRVNDGLQNIVEMAFRAYDPCFGCATHALPGGPWVSIKIFDHRHRLMRELRSDHGP